MSPRWAAPRTWRPVKKRMCIGLLGANVRDVDADEFNAMQGVERVVRVLKPYKLASRDFHPADTTIIRVNDALIGGRDVVLMAGPCSVESREQTFEVAAAAAAHGRDHPARRGVQAAHLALQLPGPGRGGPGNPGRRARASSAWRSSPR